MEAPHLCPRIAAPSGVQSLGQWVLLAGVWDYIPRFMEEERKGSGCWGLSAAAKGQGLSDQCTKVKRLQMEWMGAGWGIMSGARWRGGAPPLTDRKPSELHFILAFPSKARAGQEEKGFLTKVHWVLHGKGRC